MKKIILSLIAVVALFAAFASTLNVKAAEFDAPVLENGAQIRTDGNNGMKFVASVAAPVEGATYGFVLAKGEVANLDVNTEGAITAETTTLNESNQFYMTIVNFREEVYTQDITVKAYVAVEGEYVYSDLSVTRNLAEVASGAAVNGEAGDFGAAVNEFVAANYMKTYTIGDYVFVNNVVYETVPAKLEAAFVADWNAKFGTEMTEYTHATWAASAKAGYGEGTGMTANGDTDCSGTNAYEFFITDEATSAKWGWLLTFFLEETNTFVHPKRQINALLNNGSYSDSYGGGLQQFAHLSRSLQNFFDATGGDVYGSGIDVMIKDFAIYGAIVNYNTTVLATEQNFVAKDSEVALVNLSKPGYVFDGYKAGETLYNDSYAVNADAVLVPTFTVIEYNITYMNGEEEITDLADTYTINDTVTLPTYQPDGYVFNGWKDAEENDVLAIEAGSTGNKVFYAQLEFKPASTVTYNTDGGYLALYPSVDAAIADFLADYNAARGKSHTVDTFYALGSWGEISDASLFLYNVNYRSKWAWLVDYIASVASNANKDAWTVFNNYNTQAELNAANTNHIYRIAYELRGWVGQAQYTKNGNFPSADYSTAAVKAAYVAAVTLPTTYTYYDEVVTLPTPIKENYTFLGWVDEEGNPVTEYPGYNTATEVTYTATWKADYATVNATFDTDGGHFSMAYDANSKTASIYDNVGGADGTYLCDTSVTSKNSLRWQYKVLLQYDAELNAYQVVCLDAAKASANNAASAAGVTWTHALANSKSNISTQYTVGQYIYFENTPVVNNKNLSYMVFDTPEEIAAYQYPTTHSATYVAPEALPTPVREGYTFVGWRSSIDGQTYTEYPAYGQVSGISEVTYTAVWEVAA